MKSFLNKIIFIILATLPQVLLAKGIVPCGGKGEPVCNFCHFATLANNVLKFILFELSLPVVVIAFITAGVLLLTAGGNVSQISKAKSIFPLIGTGLLIMFSAWILVDTIARVTMDEKLGPWNEFPENCTPIPSVITPPVTQPTTPPGNGNYDTFYDSLSSDMQSLVNCMKLQEPSIVITSTTDTHIAAGTCVPNDPNETFESGARCQHTKYSCHYGGRNCRTKGSYAIDARSSNISYDKVVDAINKCALQAKCLKEGDHYHISVGASSGCGCDTQLTDCRNQ